MIFVLNPNSEVESRGAKGARPSGRFNVPFAGGSRTHQTLRTVKRRERRAPDLQPGWRGLFTSEFGLNIIFQKTAMPMERRGLLGCNFDSTQVPGNARRSGWWASPSTAFCHRPGLVLALTSALSLTPAGVRVEPSAKALDRFDHGKVTLQIANPPDGTATSQLEPANYLIRRFNPRTGPWRNPGSAHGGSAWTTPSVPDPEKGLFLLEKT